MRKPLVYVIVWLAATATVGAAAWAAVRLAGEETQPRAVAPLSAAEVAALATSSVPGTATTTVPVQDVTTIAGTTATTTTTSVGATSTSVATATTVGSSTTVVDDEPAVVAHVVDGGRVVVSLEEGRLSLVGATPTEGYTVEVKDSGPDEVVVEFEGAEDDFRVKAFVSAGEVVFEVTGGVDSVDDSDDG